VKTGAAGVDLLSSEKKVEKKADKKEATEGKIAHEILDEGVIKDKPVKAKAKKSAK